MSNTSAESNGSKYTSRVRLSLGGGFIGAALPSHSPGGAIGGSGVYPVVAGSRRPEPGTAPPGVVGLAKRGVENGVAAARTARTEVLREQKPAAACNANDTRISVAETAISNAETGIKFERKFVSPRTNWISTGRESTSSAAKGLPSDENSGLKSTVAAGGSAFNRSKSTPFSSLPNRDRSLSNSKDTDSVPNRPPLNGNGNNSVGDVRTRPPLAANRSSGLTRLRALSAPICLDRNRNSAAQPTLQVAFCTVEGDSAAGSASDEDRRASARSAGLRLEKSSQSQSESEDTGRLKGTSLLFCY